MTKFEQFLLDNGYIKYVLNCKVMKFEIPKGHTISTMVNLDHRYVHKSNTKMLKKIEQGKSVMDDDFTWNDREKEIIFGLHEAGKPPTLIHPRPKIEIKKIVKEQVRIMDETSDDSMNIVLSKIPFEDILKAMYDKSICFKFDLTNNGEIYSIPTCPNK